MTLTFPAGLAQEEPAVVVRKSPKAPRKWPGPDGKPLPFNNRNEVLSFPATAEVMEIEEIGEGITGTERVLLEEDGIRMRSIFRDVHVYERRRGCSGRESRWKKP